MNLFQKSIRNILYFLVGCIPYQLLCLILDWLFLYRFIATATTPGHPLPTAVVAVLIVFSLIVFPFLVPNFCREGKWWFSKIGLVECPPKLTPEQLYAICGGDIGPLRLGNSPAALANLSLFADRINAFFNEGK